MSSPIIYTPTAYPLGSFEIPSDGDEITASSVGVPIKAIADGLRYASRFAIIGECSDVIPANQINTDPIASTVSATNELLANITTFDQEIKYGDRIHFSCAFNAQVTGVGDGWIGAFLSYHDANVDTKYAGFACNWAYLGGSNTEIRQRIITGAMNVSVAPKASTTSAISLFGRVASGTLSLRNPLACTWTLMRAL